MLLLSLSKPLNNSFAYDSKAAFLCDIPKPIFLNSLAQIFIWCYFFQKSWFPELYFFKNPSLILGWAQSMFWVGMSKLLSRFSISATRYPRQSHEKSTLLSLLLINIFPMFAVDSYNNQLLIFNRADDAIVSDAVTSENFDIAN